MKKSISISIRVSEEELDKFKQAARLEAYEYYGAAEPPVRCGESHLSGLTGDCN